MSKVVVNIPSHAETIHDMEVRYEDGTLVEHVLDYQEKWLHGAGGTVVGKVLMLLVACDLRMDPRNHKVRGLTPVQPDFREGVCAWWYSTTDYEVKNG